MPLWEALLGDCREVLRTMPDCMFDACVCDPPYHLTSVVKRFGGANAKPAQFGKDGLYARQSKGMMGATWDGGDIAFRPETWSEVLRVLKPGGYVVAFASTRGYHRMVCAIEDAGFVIHPLIAWIFGQGFPKAHRIDAPNTEGLRYGLQSLKPAIEPICLAQKPMCGTGTANWLTWGTGALNIDACRVPTDENLNGGAYADVGGRGVSPSLHAGSGMNVAGKTVGTAFVQPLGRWPANLIHDGSDEVLEAFPNSAGQLAYVGPEHGDRPSVNTYGDYGPRPPTPPRGDSGSAARFFQSCPWSESELRLFYSGKATKADRAGSKHPTIKPLKLLSYLTKLVTPPNGLILDPFAGSGTTLEAAYREGFDCIGIEQEVEYHADILRRMKGVTA